MYKLNKNKIWNMSSSFTVRIPNSAPVGMLIKLAQRFKLFYHNPIP